MRDLDTLETRFLPGSGNIFANPFFSPDGRFLAYSSTRGELVRLSVDDNTPTAIVSGLTVVNSGSWADDDTIFYTLQGAIYRVSAQGGAPELIVPRPGDDVVQDSPRLLPDGDSLLISRKRTFEASWDEGEVVVRSLSTGDESVLLTDGVDLDALVVAVRAAAARDVGLLAHGPEAVALGALGDHSPEFFVNEDVFVTGVKLLSTLAADYLQLQRAGN